MREIKFRAWDESNGVMMEPGSVDLFIHFDGKLNHHDLGIIQGTENTPQMTLMQYTGLKDRNGKEIFEGDIVKQTYHTQTGHVHDGTDMTFDGHHTGVVIMTARGVCMKNPLHYSEDTDETNPMNAYKQVAGYRSEVIGSIYEHPHLLDGGKAYEV